MVKKRKTPKRLRAKRGGKKQRSRGLVGKDNFECRTEGCVNWVIAPADTKSILCWRCLASKVPPPVERKPPNRARAKLKSLRRAAKRSEELSDIATFPKGWHRRKHFKIKIDNKWYYFVRGKEVKHADYLLEKRKPDASMRKSGPRAGYGRGWHLKKRFEAPDGKVFSYGKEIKEKQ